MPLSNVPTLSGIPKNVLNMSSTPSSSTRAVGFWLLASLTQRNVRLARADTNRERIQTLTDLAADLHRESKAIAAAADEKDLTALAQMYSNVVRDGVVGQARSLPAQDRGKVLNDLVDRLEEMEKQADRLAEVLPTTPANSLRKIAGAAREGTQELRALMREER